MLCYSHTVSMQIKYADGKTSEHIKVRVNYTIKLHFDCLQDVYTL